jgi:hypothetical protein
VVTPVDSRGWMVGGWAQASAPQGQPVLSIKLQTPARAVVIPMIRTVAADLAVRANFEVNSIDDLRMAVDDACAMLVRIALGVRRLAAGLPSGLSGLRRSLTSTSSRGLIRCPPDRLDGRSWSASRRRCRPVLWLLGLARVGECGSRWVNTP